jgi:hypothetical protein
LRPTPLAAALVLMINGVPADAGDLDPALSGTSWGESSAELLHLLGDRATVLPHPIDFGDSYAEIVLRRVPVGGYPMIAYYQMDKTQHGLKRIQLEMPRHRVNPPAFRAILTALEHGYGTADTVCAVSSAPASGFQAAVEYLWRRSDSLIRAVYRDTTLEAFEGCFFPPCGLTGQLLVRASPASEAPTTCRGSAPPRG